MFRNNKLRVRIPLTVPRRKHREYLRNFHLATRGTGRLFMFACDQKVEHLNDDFRSPDLAPEISDPEHFFRIASRSHIGAMATQLGLIAKYGSDYPKIPYIIKLNSKTNILKTTDKDPIANTWNTMKEVIAFKRQNRIPLLGIGYTIYIGSWYESEMFRQAAELIHEAHQEGLLTILWMYPRGKAVPNEKDPALIAGGAGVALCLGADFVKLHAPQNGHTKSGAFLHEAVVAAGRTGVICVGGAKKSPQTFLQSVYDQVHVAGARGAAIGRNIWQRPLHEAIGMANALAAIIYRGTTPKTAYKIFKHRS